METDMLASERYYPRIESNIPIPTRRQSVYPWDGLGIGDSFLVPAEKEPSIRAFASKLKRETDAAYTVRKLPEGVRVWRVA